MNPDDPISDLGFQITAMYHLPGRDGSDNVDVIVDVRVHSSSAKAVAACDLAERRKRSSAQVVVEEEPLLGGTGFLWHHEANARYGPRATFCERNVYVTASPSHRSVEVARKVYEHFMKSGSSDG